MWDAKRRAWNAYQFQCMLSCISPSDWPGETPSIHRYVVNKSSTRKKKCKSIVHLSMCTVKYLLPSDGSGQQATLNHSRQPLLTYSDLINGNSYISEIAIFTTGIFQIPTTKTWSIRGDRTYAAQHFVVIIRLCLWSCGELSWYEGAFSVASLCNRYRSIRHNEWPDWTGVEVTGGYSLDHDRLLALVQTLSWAWFGVVAVHFFGGSFSFTTEILWSLLLRRR